MISEIHLYIEFIVAEAKLSISLCGGRTPERHLPDKGKGHWFDSATLLILKQKCQIICYNFIIRGKEIYMKKYKTDFTKKELHKALHAKDSEATAIIEDENKWAAFKTKFDVFMKKAEKIPILGGMIDDIACMVSLVDSYIKKEYSDIPVGTIISIVAALIYLLSPIDLIPDFVPVVGYLDDAAIVFFVLNFGVDKDLEKYRKWNEDKRKKALGKFEQIFAEEIRDIIKERFLSAVILCEGKTIKLLITENQNNNIPVECIIKEVNVPLKLLGEFSVEDNDQMIELLNEMIVLNCIKWINDTEKRVYLEYDFEDKWDDYIIMEVD